MGASLFCVTIVRSFWPIAAAHLTCFFALSYLQGQLDLGVEFVPAAWFRAEPLHFLMTLGALVSWRPRPLFKRLPDDAMQGSS